MSIVRDNDIATRIDLHVHTGRYSQCAECVNPYEVSARARNVGLTGLVLTDHDVFWQDEEIDMLRAASPNVLVYRGIEVTAKGCHLVVIGVKEAERLSRGITVEEAAEIVDDLGGTIILAHPFRDCDPSMLPIHLVDAIEIGSTSFSATDTVKARNLARHYGKPAVAGSDAHALSRIGWAWTEFPFPPANEVELAEAIRFGLGRPVLNEGNTGRKQVRIPA